MIYRPKRKSYPPSIRYQLFVKREDGTIWESLLCNSKEYFLNNFKLTQFNYELWKVVSRKRVKLIKGGFK